MKRRHLLLAVLLLAVLLLACSLFAQTTASPKLGVISGTIIDAATEQTIAKVVVTLQDTERTDQDNKNLSRTVSTDATGHYEFRNVQSGVYTVEASKPGFLDTAYGSRKKTGTNEIPLTITEGQSLAGINIELQRAAAISGKVVNEDGDPLPNARLWASKLIHGAGGRRELTQEFAETDDRGEYRIHDLEPGKYVVACLVEPARHPTVEEEDRAYPLIYYPSATSAESASPIVLTAGAEAIANFSLTALPAHTLRGRVIGIKDENVTLNLALVTGSGLPFGGLGERPRKDGTFEIKNVLPGTYSLNAVHFTEEGQPDFAAKKIKVGDTDLNGITFNLEGTIIEVHGNVHVSEDSAFDYTKLMVNATPSVIPVTGDDSEVETFQFGARSDGTVKKDGSFALSFNPTSHHLFVSVSNRSPGFDDWYIKSASFGGRSITDSGFVPTQGSTLQILLSSGGAQIQGTVVDRSGKPVPGATIAAVPDETRRGRRDLYHGSTSDQLGHFRIRGVAPGTYKLFAFDEVDSQDYYFPEFLQEYLSKGQDMKIEEKGRYGVELQVIVTQPEEETLPK